MVLPPFATASDLAARLGVPLWPSGELERVVWHLEDASDDLRAEIGWQVYPPVAVTVDVEPDSFGRVALVGAPVAEVSSVTQDGTLLTPDRYEWSGGLLRLSAVGTASVTYTVGYATPPADLQKWTCVIAAQSLARAADETLGATPSSEALADYRISYSERQQLGELPVPMRVLERLRSIYGQAVYST